MSAPAARWLARMAAHMHARARARPPPPKPARLFPAPTAVATRVCVAAATTQSLRGALQRPPHMRRPLPVPRLVVARRAERTTIAFFVVQASCEGRRVLLSGSKTSRTRVTEVPRPSAARPPRGAIEATPVVVSPSMGMAPTPLVVDRAAPPLPHRQDSPQPAKNAPKNAPNAPHRQDSTPSLRNAPNAAACLVRVETKRCPTGTAGLLEERSYPP